MIRLRVQAVEADSVGLPQGTYNLFLDFPGDTLDTTGTITIGATSVTAFHVSDPQLGQYDCSPCVSFTASPDFVIINDPQAFLINDSPLLPTVRTLVLSTLTGNLVQHDPSAESGGEVSGTWNVVPEPVTSYLFLFGLGALGLWRRLRAKQD